nr:dCTP deaminase [Methanoculleus sp.]
FCGTLTLEMTNVMCRPIELYSGMPIAQLVFFEGECARVPYKAKPDAKYNGQKGAQPSRFYKNVRHV